MNIKYFFKKVVYGEKVDSDTYIKFLRSKGVEIGENCHFFSLPDVTVDISYPWLISIGNNVQITKGVIILTHDYSWSVLKHYKTEESPMGGRVLGAGGSVNIGNNVFIGMNTVVLKNTQIGNNVIIGAGSVVKGVVESNSVYAGNPARKIMSLEMFYKKRVSRQYIEAVELAKAYYKRTGKIPQENIFHEFFMLFRNDRNNIPCNFDDVLKLTGNEEASLMYLSVHKPMFCSFDEFIDSIDFEEQHE